MPTCASCRRIDRGACPSAHKPVAGCGPNTPACRDYQYVERDEDEVTRLFAPAADASPPGPGSDVADGEAEVTEVVPASPPPPHGAEAATDVEVNQPQAPEPEGTLIDLEQFSERAVKAIEALGVTTYEELAGTPNEVIDEIPDIGKATIKEICDKLVELGFLEAPAE